ncbi:MAG TPA: hypothetical protein DCZ91_25375 [Lachnospiraceae bacterium]|nr:hypothetical protein [Lachnospiraceae bacterium]
MKFRENVNALMSELSVSEEMHRAIMEGNPENAKHRITSHVGRRSRGMTGAGSGMNIRNGRNVAGKGKPVWRQAAVPAVAVLLIMSTMYVGAGFLIDHTPLRDIFISRDDSALPVPEAQRRPDIYGEILDASYSSAGNQAEAGMETGIEVKAEAGAGTEAKAGTETGEAAVHRGKYGEIVMDNELFSIEMLEMTCAGRELTASYILTRKTDQCLTVQVSIDNDYLGQWKDGLAGEEYDTSRTLTRSSFGDTFRWNMPADCGYELAENQELCIITQLGKADYAPGTYTLYAQAYLHEHVQAPESGGETFQLEEIPEGEIQDSFYRTSIEIVHSGDYGLALSGALDKTEEQVHFDQYEIYVSPLTVYLTLDGTYQGEVTAVWGMRRSHDITIGFADGSQTQATVLLSGMGYGKGEIDVDMRASFGTAIDPASIVKVMLDGKVLMEE